MPRSPSTSLSPAGNLSLLAVACLTIMVGCVIVPGLPSIGRALGVQPAAGWLVTTPALGVVVLGPWAAWLLGRAGLRTGLRIGLLAYGALGMAGAALHGYVAVFADRLLLGGATAVVMAAGTGLIATFHRGAARLRMIARQGMAIEMGGVLFLFLAGLMAAVTWWLPFTLYALAWLCLILVECFVPAKLPVDAATDPPPQMATNAPRLPRALVRVYASALVSMVLFFTGVVLLPARLQHAAFSEAQTGYFLSFVSCIAVVAAMLMPRITRWLGQQGCLRTGFVAYALAHLCFALGSHALPWLVGGLLMGLGFGLTIPLVNHMTVELSHEPVRGRHLAYLSMAIFSGQFLASFMTLIPGNSHLAFACASGLALLVAVGDAVSGRR